MRVISGRWKGRRFHIPSANWPVRPTTDFAREALFNILDNRVNYEEISALELFGGTGMHSIELASRGCRDITYVDRHKESVLFLRKLSKELEAPIRAVQSDAISFLRKTTDQWDYIFADPPYDYKQMDELLETVLAGVQLKPDGFFVLEHSSKLKFNEVSLFSEARQYGQTVFSFFKQGS